MESSKQRGLRWETQSNTPLIPANLSRQSVPSQCAHFPSALGAESRNTSVGFQRGNQGENLLVDRYGHVQMRRRGSWIFLLDHSWDPTRLKNVLRPDRAVGAQPRLTR
jgi:hypothetical protein